MNTDNTDTFGKPPHHNDNDPKQDTTPILSGDDKHKDLCDDNDIMNVKYLLPLYVCMDVMSAINNDFANRSTPPLTITLPTSNRPIVSDTHVANSVNGNIKGPTSLLNNLNHSNTNIASDHIHQIKKSTVYSISKTLAVTDIAIDFLKFFDIISKNSQSHLKNSTFSAIDNDPDNRYGNQIIFNNSDITWQFRVHNAIPRPYYEIVLECGTDGYSIIIEQRDKSALFKRFQHNDNKLNNPKINGMLDDFLTFLNSFPETEKAKFILPTAQESGASSSTDQPPLIRTETDTVTKVPHPVAEMPAKDLSDRINL